MGIRFLVSRSGSRGSVRKAVVSGRRESLEGDVGGRDDGASGLLLLLELLGGGLDGDAETELGGLLRALLDGSYYHYKSGQSRGIP